MNEQANYFKPYLKKALVLLMAVVMVFTYMPSMAWAASTQTATVTVSILGAEGNELISQELTVDKFDVKPFLTEQTDSGNTRTDGNDSFVESDNITLANALIEAVYFKETGKDGTSDTFTEGTGDQAEETFAAVVETVKKGLNIYYNPSYQSLSINSVLGDASLVMSVVRSANGQIDSSGLSAAINKDDRIAFYQSKYPDTYNYSYFDVMNVSSSVSYGYPVIKLKLKANQLAYDENWSLVPYVVENMSIYKSGDAGYYEYGVTSKTGVAEFDVWGSSIENGTYSFMMYGNDWSGTKTTPYLKVSYSFNGSEVSNIEVSEAVKEDTSLSVFTANIYGEGSIDLSNYVSNSLPLEISSNVTSLKVKVTPAADDATVTGGLEEGENTVEFVKGETEKTLSFTVTNGSDSEVYTLSIVRKDENALTVANRIANGIINYEGSSHNADYVLSKIALGKSITDSEKADFLQSVLATSKTSIGSLAKNAIALTALGIDATKIPDADDTVFDSVAAVENADLSKVTYLSHKAYMLLLYDLGVYDVEQSNREALIDSIIAGYDEAYSGWHGNGLDSAAMMIEALAPYYSATGGYNEVDQEKCEKIKTYIDSELTYIKSVQQTNGTFGNDANTTAVVIRALMALGIDPNGSEYTQSATGKTALTGLYLFRTEDNTLGWKSPTYNSYASSDGLTAVTSYINYAKSNSKTSIYRFEADKSTINVYNAWPNKTLLTGLIAIPTKTNYSKQSSANTGINAADLKVYKVYNSDDNTKVEIKDYTLAYDLTTSGTQKVTVSYNGLTTNYNVTVADGSSTTRENTVSCTITGLSQTVKENSYAITNGETVMDVLKAVLNKNGISVTVKNGNYVSSIGGKSEFDKGPNSGWMYSVNGVTPPTTAANEYILKGGESILWYYTTDYTKDSSSSSWNTTTTVTTDTTSGSAATTTAPTETKVTEKTNADGTKEKTATVTVSAANQTEIVKQAADKKSAEIVLEVASTATAGAQNVQLQLNVSFVKNVSEKTDAALTVNTENGTVSLDQNTIKTVLDEAKGTTITLDVNKVANPTEVQKKAAGESGQILSLTVKSGDKTISDFKTGKVTVTVAISTALQNKRVAAIHIAEDGKIEQMPGKSREVGGKKCYEFTTSHFSDFALVDADELGLETEDEIDAAALVAKLTPVARSAKTAKGYIKVTTNLDKSDKAIISELTDAGYTVKYRFYRSTKKSASYKSALTKKTTSYTNTSGKKGTKYYYKVQVRVYDESGKLVAKTALRQCRYATRKF